MYSAHMSSVPCVSHNTVRYESSTAQQWLLGFLVAPYIRQPASTSGILYYT